MAPSTRTRPQRPSDRTPTGNSNIYPHHKPAKYPLNKLKSRIRDLERLMRGAQKIPEEKKTEYERELETCRSDLVHNAAQNRKAEIAKKYHMVRFFDRRKAERVLKQAQKALELCPEDDAGRLKVLKRGVKEAELDLNYTLYYPVSIAYCSLHPKSSSSDDTDSIPDPSSTKPRGNIEIRALVKKAMKDKTLSTLRETLHPDELGLELSTPKIKHKLGTSVKTDSSQAQRLIGGKDDDGGFFE